MGDALSVDMGAGNPGQQVEADPTDSVDVSKFVPDWPEQNMPMTASDKEALRLMAQPKAERNSPYGLASDSESPS